MSLVRKFEKLKQDYRKVFLETVEDIQSCIERVRPESFKGEIFEYYEIGSIGYSWQQAVLSLLEARFFEYKNFTKDQIKSFYNDSRCVGCGTCCNFAVSEFSYEDLILKAKNGDSLASQFVSIFVPYESIDEVKDIFPEYVALLNQNTDSKYFFYHCPKVTKDNKCSDYENRPQICRDFPDNPIAFLPKKCGYNIWKLKSESVSLKLKAEAEIVNFYQSKIKELYSNENIIWS